MLTRMGETYFVETATDLGRALVAAAPVRSATKADMEAHQRFAEEKRSNFHYKLPYEMKYLPEVLEASYDSLVWEAIARRCFSCGSCNLVCPTCYCFDVYDRLEDDLSGGCRVRRYDSCQLDPFAEVAGGENFRAERSSRLRHRMFRKGKYILEQTGRVGCVSAAGGASGLAWPASASRTPTSRSPAAASRNKVRESRSGAAGERAARAVSEAGTRGRGPRGGTREPETWSPVP